MCPADTAAHPICRPSHTARIAALFRAVHRIRRSGSELLDDTLAGRLLGFSDDASLIEDFNSRPVSRFEEFDSVFAARSRYTEDELDAAFKRGADQYVILGAGLDTFAHRCPRPMRQIRVFEVDAAPTQVWKRARLAELGIQHPPNLRYVTANLEHGGLAEHLVSAGLDRGRPVFISLLGVGQYLEEAALTRLLSEAPGLSDVACTLIMENIIPPGTVEPEEQASLDFVMAGSAANGESWKTFLSIDDAVALLRASGFARVRVVDRPLLQFRYFDARPALALPPRYAPLLRADRDAGSGPIPRERRDELVRDGPEQNRQD